MLALTLREAAEQLFGLQAIREYFDERAKNRRDDEDNAADDDMRGWEEKMRAPPITKVRDDEEARRLADTPHLTGDPEWDAIELAETDPSRPPLSERMRGIG